MDAQATPQRVESPSPRTRSGFIAWTIYLSLWLVAIGSSFVAISEIGQWLQGAQYTGYSYERKTPSWLSIAVAVFTSGYLLWDFVRWNIGQTKQERDFSLWGAGPGGFVMMGGVVLPGLVLAFALFLTFNSLRSYGFSSEYDLGWRLWTLIALTLATPAFNIYSWFEIVKHKGRNIFSAGLAIGAAAAMGLLFTLIFIQPTMQIAGDLFRHLPEMMTRMNQLASASGMIAMGLALLVSLVLVTPVLSLCASIVVVWQLVSVSDSRRALRASLASLVGLCLPLAAIFTCDVTDLITRQLCAQAELGLPQERRAAIRTVRALNLSGDILRYAYDEGRFTPASMNLMKELLQTCLPYSMPQVSQETARALYYTVTGTRFNFQPNPFHSQVSSWWSDLAGESVGGRVTGLSLDSSNLDCQISTGDLCARQSWTVVFKNDTDIDQEARTQIALPHKGAVSRLTLWIDGKPQEAAFDERGVVRQAYRTVVAQRRDPALVTSAGPDRVLLQCFPVPAQSTMKLRLEICAPLAIDQSTSAGKGQEEVAAHISLPVMTECNFAINHYHVVSLSADRPMQLSKPFSDGSSTKAQAKLNAAQLTFGDASTIRFAALPVQARSYKDVRTSGLMISQKIEARKLSRPSKLYVVVDGGESMQKYASVVSQALETWPNDIPMQILFASDEITSLAAESGQTKVDGKAAARLIAGAPFVGGPVNTIALCQAIAGKDTALSGQSGGARILWIHGTQPIAAGSVRELPLVDDAFSARLVIAKVPIYDFAVEPGPNAVAEAIENAVDAPAYKATPVVIERGAGVAADLKRCLAQLAGAAPEYVIERHCGPEEPKAAKSTATQSDTRTVFKLTALEQARHSIDLGERNKAAHQASHTRLVTPVTGAVVLASEYDYQRLGLTGDHVNADPPADLGQRTAPPVVVKVQHHAIMPRRAPGRGWGRLTPVPTAAYERQSQPVVDARDYKTAQPHKSSEEYQPAPSTEPAPARAPQQLGNTQITDIEMNDPDALTAPQAKMDGDSLYETGSNPSSSEGSALAGATNGLVFDAPRDANLFGGESEKQAMAVTSQLNQLNVAPKAANGGGFVAAQRDATIVSGVNTAGTIRPNNMGHLGGTMPALPPLTPMAVLALTIVALTVSAFAVLLLVLWRRSSAVPAQPAAED